MQTVSTAVAVSCLLSLHLGLGKKPGGGSAGSSGATVSNMNRYSYLPKGLSPVMHEHAGVHYLIIIKHWNFLAMQWGKDSIFLLL